MKNQVKDIIVITGGAGGIGTATAKMFKETPIILTDYSQDQVDKSVQKFRAEG